MDVELEGVEIMFAQKLACGEPRTRQRALTALHDWLRSQSVESEFKEEDMMRLCKGLHYVLWMQDKMLLQEELADRIANLLHIFSREGERALFIKCIFKSLAKEWHSVDRWRMDKFLMLLRRVVRVLFAHLKSCNWKKDLRAPYWKSFGETTINNEKSGADGLKYHFAAIFLDELDNAGGLTKKQLTICLQPFAEILGAKKTSDYLFGSFVDEIFMTILHQRSEELANDRDDGEPVSSGGIQFDYNAIGTMLFDIGKNPQVTSDRRRKLYDIVKKFQAAAKGADPFPFEEPVVKQQLRFKDIDDAADRIVADTLKVRREREIFKKSKKNTAAKKDSANDLNLPIVGTKVKKTAKRSKPAKRGSQLGRHGKRSGQKVRSHK